MLTKMKTGVVLQIPLEDLKEDKNNFFETEGGVEIEKKNAEMADSIETDGLISPVVVRPDPEESGKYIIVSGHRRKMIYGRLAAQGKEKFAKVPCIIRNIKDELRAQLMLIESNSTGREISDWEKAQAVKAYGEIIDKMKQGGEEMAGGRRDHIAAALGISKTQVGQYEHINKKLTPEYKEEMKRGNIGVTVADKLASLPEEDQKELHEKNPAPKVAEIQNGIFADTEPAPEKGKQTTPQPQQPRGEKRTGEIYDRALKKMDECGFGGLEPCEQCTVASCCEKCCKTCQKPCDTKQQCRKEKMKAGSAIETATKKPMDASHETENKVHADVREWAIERIIGRLENIAGSERDMAAAVEGQDKEQHEAAAEYADEFVEMAKRDLLDSFGINMF